MSTISRIVFPRQMTPDRLLVESSTHERLWSWGSINVSGVDFDRYVAPAMEELYGSETWAEIQAAVDEVYRLALEQQEELTCAALEVAEAALSGAQEAAGANVEELQMNLGCGECNAVSTEFYEDFVWYIQLNIEAMFAEMFIDVVPSGVATLPLKLAAVAMWMSIQATIEGLPCDYECFFYRARGEIYVNVAIYYASEGMLELIDRYRDSDYITCPPDAASASPLRPPG